MKKILAMAAFIITGCTTAQAQLYAGGFLSTIAIYTPDTAARVGNNIIVDAYFYQDENIPQNAVEGKITWDPLVFGTPAFVDGCGKWTITSVTSGEVRVKNTAGALVQGDACDIKISLKAIRTAAATVITSTPLNAATGYGMAASTNSFKVYPSLNGGTALPLTLLFFDATKAGAHTTMLNWSTAAEVNTVSFIAERSNNGSTWSRIGKVATAGSNSTHDYEYEDSAPVTGNNYYRLAIEEVNGAITYSSVRTVNFDGKSDGTIRFYPVPVSDRLFISGLTDTAVIRVYDATGTQVKYKTTDGNMTKEISMDGLAGGVYFITVTDNHGEVLGSAGITKQ